MDLLRTFATISVALAFCAGSGNAQQDTTRHGMPGMQMPKQDTSRKKMPAMSDHIERDTMSISMDGPLGISMERMGSGTTWVPDAVTLPARHFMKSGWSIMLHGFAFAQYDKQSSRQRSDQLGSLNWAMIMADHPVAGGHLQLRFMPSLDAATVGKCGYPLLLQSGETCHGRTLVDRQHPPALFMVLAAVYQRAITSNVGVLVYAAPAGEPALGPVAFMHRPSAMDNLAAPLGHHWQDATHVSFGVATAGLYARKWQLEGSVFNGREPDENRWDFDKIRLDSYSGRLTVNPTRHWSMTAGYGYLKSPEALRPDESMHRLTASVLHGTGVGSDGQWASAFIWGSNKHSATAGWSNGFLAESEAILDKHNTLFGRAEVVTKGAEDLVVDNPVTLRSGRVLAGFPGDQKFDVGAVQLGYIRELGRLHWATIGLGAAATINFVPTSLEPYYGSRNPTGLVVFGRLRPFHPARPRMATSGMDGMQMKHEQ